MSINEGFTLKRLIRDVEGFYQGLNKSTEEILKSSSHNTKQIAWHKSMDDEETREDIFCCTMSAPDARNSSVSASPVTPIIGPK